ncbi:hypothetical protein PCYB_005190 [Plasmodium cynomolgi strain B]|uniref:CYIR protein n=1 Tax=Plasmodium cynomolgi (strain B) TaxID=1120755 RepID=K6V354_PLACD|nr:hypothetical protein PCYB_005190 [Plasmodium cynomolgi strain B]GAB69770.1 hypothetical protein PCYB_005190 [Plasmodium cynomolgi strain B]
MSDDTLDITKWEHEYPFLNTVWQTYKPLDEDVKDILSSSNINNVCDQIFTKNRYESNENNKKFCQKLVRNLGCYNFDYKYYYQHTDFCAILYYWVYKTKQEKNIDITLINEIFNNSFSKTCTYDRIAKCYYYSYYDEFEEPVNIIFWDIFQKHMDIIRDNLHNPHYSINANLLTYICKCVYIYKKCIKNIALINMVMRKREITRVTC